MYSVKFKKYVLKKKEKPMGIRLLLDEFHLIDDDIPALSCFLRMGLGKETVIRQDLSDLRKRCTYDN